MDKTLKQIKPMDCPVCNKFYFTELTDEELEEGATPNTEQCMMCGWYYDLEQLADPDLKNESNEMSLNEYKEWYKQKIKKNRRWKHYLDNIPAPTPHPCPVCGEYTFKNSICYDICPVCGWEDTGFEDCPDEPASLYGMSFNERKKWFQEKRKLDPKFKAYPEVKTKITKKKKS